MPVVLTDLERRILDYMVQYLRTHTYQPSIREIGEEFEIKSTKTVSEHLGALAEKGYLERDPSRSRGVRILGVDLSPQTVSIPCFTALPDPRTGFAGDGIEGHYSVDRRLAGTKGCYFVRARSDEFSSLGIERGDFLLVEPTSWASVRDGDLVVLHGDRGSELHRYSRNGVQHYLRPARSDAATLAVDDPTRLEVTGRAVGLYRRFEDAAVPVGATAH